MVDNKKYYYMRLKENFFDTDEMKIMESLPDGYLYSNILLKMYLASLKNEGRLMLKNVIPYNADMIASLTRHQVGTVEKALEIFKNMGLIEIMDNGAIYMMEIQSYIGTASSEADRKREYRQSIAAEKAGQMSGQMSDKRTPEIKDKSIEIRDQIIKKIEKKKYGAGENVLLTDEEYEKLQARFPDYLERIDRLSYYIGSKGVRYKSHYMTILNWASKEKETPARKKEGRLDWIDNIRMDDLG